MGLQILYIDSRAAGCEPPDKVQLIHAWTWRQSPFVRWSYRNASGLAAADLNGVSLVVLYWDRTEPAMEACQLIRQQPDGSPTPLLLLKRHEMEPEAIVQAIGDWDGRRLLLASERPPDSQIENIFRKLGVGTPGYTLRVDIDESDPSCRDLLEAVGRKRLAWRHTVPDNDDEVRGAGRQHLAHLIQRFFPSDSSVSVKPVGGGWSGDALCKFRAGKEQKEYFLKFYSDSGRYLEEFNNHVKAFTSLGKHTVQLQRVPDLGEEGELQLEAFPEETTPPIYPMCFESAATGHVGRRTLKALCVEAKPNFLEDATASVLTVVARKPSERIEEEPWGFGPRNRFYLSGPIKRGVLLAIENLEHPGLALCADWTARCEKLKKLIYWPLAKHEWLVARVYVQKGDIHEDPNSRNCLFPDDSALDLKLIDCGQFKEGRLVSDLAMIERDLKLVLLGTDLKSGGFLDLDSSRLAEWCLAEAKSIGKGLAYQVADVDEAAESSVGRVYRSIAQVRLRARELSGDFDPTGIHFFAALLYWTLDVLKEQGVRDTKKLLGIFSAAAILTKFDPKREAKGDAVRQELETVPLRVT